MVAMPNGASALLDTGQKTMTGGCVLCTKPFIPEDTFMVTYGDGVSDIDLSSLAAYHKSQGRVATVATVKATFAK
jgi:glucose-1-phosphate cytidylyltransferase